MRQILAITRKELEGYFGSPLALIFLGSFLAVELLVFFNVETFFARNIADIRPLFTWMPLLLILLLAALTMRQWSEEQRSGTLEVLLTLPVKQVQLFPRKPGLGPGLWWLSGRFLDGRSLRCHRPLRFFPHG
jgi:ABC-2 type transport system permease protein